MRQKIQDISYMMGTESEEKKYIEHNRDRYKIIFRELDEISEKCNGRFSILDVGTSPLTFMLKKRYKHAVIHSIDYTNHFKKRCTKEGIKFRQSDLNNPANLLTFGTFDAILFLEVIEHLSSNHSHVINYLKKLMKPRGLLLIQTPNSTSFKGWIEQTSLVKIWNMFSELKSKPIEFDHVKEYTLKELEKLISNCDLAIMKSEHSLYFDMTESSLTYRKFKFLFKPFLKLYYFFVLLLPNFRRGLFIKAKLIE